jgi:uncharacterized protein YdhG (YjbR/CyaY superfamily)
MQQSKKPASPAGKSAKRATVPAKKFQTTDEYLKALEPSMRSLMNGLRKTIRKVVPDAEETISYNIPAFKFHGVLIWYAAWKAHISIYPRSSAMQSAIKELASYEGAKGTIKIPVDRPLPVEMIQKIVKFRMKENLANGK